MSHFQNFHMYRSSSLVTFFPLEKGERSNSYRVRLIRTGSAEHNIKLSRIALAKGMKLSFKGLTKEGKVIASTEREIFDLLDLPYVEPEERD